MGVAHCVVNNCVGMAHSYSSSKAKRVLKLRDVEVKTKTVQQALAPLIEQVSRLTHNDATVKFNNRVRDVRNLIHVVSRAAEGFVTTGEQIASENPDYQEEMWLACEEVRHAGDSLQQAANEYASNPLKKRRRDELQERAGGLLRAATRLLVLADMIDISKILKATSRIEAKLRSLQESTSWEEFMGRLKQTAAEINTVSEMATIRLQADTKSAVAQQLLVEAQAELNSCNKMLVSTTKVFLQHRHVDQAKQNHDYVISRMTDALHTIASLADGEDIEVIKSRHATPSLPPGDVAGSLDTIESLLDLSNKMSSVERLDHLHHHMDLISSATSVFADSNCTTPSSCDGEGLKAQCELMDEMLQDLASLFSHQSEGGSERVGRMALQLAVGAVKEQANTLKSDLHQVMVDQVSTVLMDPYQSLDALVEAAQRGDEHAVMSYAHQFNKQTEEMIKVAGMACALSLDKEASSVTATAAQHLQSLAPEVVAAARTLCARPRNQLVQQNMMVFQEVWLENVALLVDAVHNMVPLSSLITATENRVSEASDSILQAAIVQDLPTVRHHTHTVRAHCKQLVQLVSADMRDNTSGYHDDGRREAVSTALHQLGNVALVQLNEAVGIATERLSGGEHLSDVDMRLLKEDVDQLNQTVRGVSSLYSTQSKEEDESEESDEQDTSDEEGVAQDSSSSSSSEEEERVTMLAAALAVREDYSAMVSPNETHGSSQRRLIKRTPSVVVIDTEDTAQAMMAQLPAHELARLAKVQEGLQIEKRELEREVSQWDDRENDIVLLAKEMCWMMLDLADFARGMGPLKVTADVINTAIDIARGGEYLNLLARQIADLCPDRHCRSDLLAYLERVKLCCHQLRITSAVRADLDTTTSETVENASNMIVAAKNVMNAVVLIVKSCYIASVAITRREGTMPVQLVQWKMSTPKKKTLYSQPSTATRSTMSAIQELGEFRGRQVSHGRGAGQ